METKDLDVLKEKNITAEQFEEQLSYFKTGFPFLKIEKAAELNNGIIAISDQKEIDSYLSVWDRYLSTGEKSVIKFVPASGAASRMFKDLFEFLDSSSPTPTSKFENTFFDHIKMFAFYDDLNEMCIKNNHKNIDDLIKNNEHKAIVANLLHKDGLNYGQLPKGLLKFHHYNKDENKTPVEEHLVEGALYAQSGSNVKLHFTASTEHKILFEQHIASVIDKYSNTFDVKYNISLSEQKKSTDTIAADANNMPFRENGALIFRPGGHGALIENLNDLNGDVIFIKNIDNVVPEKLNTDTVKYKKLIAGILISLQKKTFAYLNELNKADISTDKLNEILLFCEKELNNRNESANSYNREALIDYLKTKLNRPIRVCGMVKNEGEPGGGPYLVKNNDGSVSPQILESSQIDMNDTRSVEIMKTSTHFNPVDLVCATKDYMGNKFDLTQYVDKNTGFISSKSKNGKELKALELPGLWNGAMSNWNTIFVEVPVSTFNPVKTINDLLRKEHQ